MWIRDALEEIGAVIKSLKSVSSSSLLTTAMPTTFKHFTLFTDACVQQVAVQEEREARAHRTRRCTLVLHKRTKFFHTHSSSGLLPGLNDAAIDMLKKYFVNNDSTFQNSRRDFSKKTQTNK